MNTIHVQCSAVYSDGTTLIEDAKLIGCAKIEPMQSSTLRQHPDYRLLTLQLAVPKESAQELLTGLTTGQVYLSVEGMKTALEQAA